MPGFIKRRSVLLWGLHLARLSKTKLQHIRQFHFFKEKQRSYIDQLYYSCPIGCGLPPGGVKMMVSRQHTCIKAVGT